MVFERSRTKGLSLNDALVPFGLGYGLRTRQLQRPGSRYCLIKVVLDLPAQNKVIIWLDDWGLVRYSR